MATLSISKEFKMDSAHLLEKHPGKCANLHGHTYSLGVELTGLQNKETGFVLDYAELNLLVKPLVDFLDHKYLNLFIRYPSAENIALHLLVILKGLRVANIVVSVSETQATNAFASRSAIQDWSVGDDTWSLLRSKHGWSFAEFTEANSLYPHAVEWQSQYRELILVVLDRVKEINNANF